VVTDAHGIIDKKKKKGAESETAAEVETTNYSIWFVAVMAVFCQFKEKRKT